MTLYEMARACEGELLFAEGLEKENIGRLCMDSRQIQKGDIFVAAKGERVDGHAFIDKTFDAGALAVICEALPEKPKGPCVLVKSSTQALKDVAAAYRDSLKIPVVGITGSVGKTSTKEMVASALSTRLRVLKTAGNMNNTLGLPMMITRIGREDQVAVLEMGISDFGEMTQLSREAKPDICVITNIGQCHLEFLHDRDGILKAKTEIFTHMKEGATVILNGDDDKLSTIHEVKGRKPIFYGIDNKDGNCDYYADDIEDLGLLGSDLIVNTPVGMTSLHVPLPGRHMIGNALAAIAVGISLGMDLPDLVEGIANAKALDGRDHIIQTGDYTILDDCYNASPASMRSALDLLSSAKGRKVAVLGDMFELGKEEEMLHTGVGEYAVARCDLLLCAGALSRHMKEGFVPSGREVFHYETMEELKRNLLGHLKKGDTILVKASHGMQFAELVKYLEESK